VPQLFAKRDSLRVKHEALARVDLPVSQESRLPSVFALAEQFRVDPVPSYLKCPEGRGLPQLQIVKRRNHVGSCRPRFLCNEVDSVQLTPHDEPMTARRLALGLTWACLANVALVAQGPVPHIATPNQHLFPGATNPLVTQANIKTTICQSGWTATIRPTTSYTNTLKKAQQHTLGYETANPLPRIPSASGKTTRADITKCKEHSVNPSCWEEDHLISLELGGDPRSPDNLWPEPWFGDWNAHIKDTLETTLKRKVCAGEVTLAEAQQAIASDWVAAYRNYIGEPVGWLRKAPSRSHRPRSWRPVPPNTLSNLNTHTCVLPNRGSRAGPNPRC
jgi:hypothetical protein